MILTLHLDEITFYGDNRSVV